MRQPKDKAATRTTLSSLVNRAVERIGPPPSRGGERAAATRARLRRLLARNTVVWPHRDAYVVGYPKVGNTWFQVMLRMALVRYYNLDEAWLSQVLHPQREGDEPPPAHVPHIEVTYDMTSFPEGDYPRVQRDHRRYAGKRVVLLIRDPKDTLVSLYMHYAYRDEATPYRGTVDELVYDREFGLTKYLQFYRAWHRDRRRPSGIHLVRYEDMQADTAGVFRRAAEFLGMRGISDAIIDECIAFGSFDNMRRMERENTLGIVALAPSPRGIEKAYKVRRGVVGGYRDHLSEATIAYIDRRVRRELPPVYGYPRAAAVAPVAPTQARRGLGGS